MNWLALLFGIPLAAVIGLMLGEDRQWMRDAKEQLRKKQEKKP
jgi:hypothetical protein